MSAIQKWKAKLRPASWRKIDFFVDSSTYAGGRRGTDHEFPDRNIPYADDTGRKGKKYDVQAYLVGSEYLSKKNDLIAALEKDGPGELVHPFYGNVRVEARDFTVEERADKGGYVRITVKFTEAGSLSFPKVGEDSGFLVSSSAGALSDAAQADFADKFSVANQPQFLLDSAAAKVNSVADDLTKATSGISGSAAGIAELAFTIRNIKATARDIIATPAKLAQQLDNAFSLLSGALNPSDVLAACKKMFSFGDADAQYNVSTPTRQAEANNSIALNQMTQALAVTYASTAAIDISYTSVEDATTVRDQLGDQLDKLMETTSNDDVYQALQAHRARVVLAIPPSDQTLAHVSTYTPSNTVPSLIVAYDLYGSVDQEQDIIDRNSIQNPGFIPGGQPLEVLEDG